MLPSLHLLSLILQKGRCLFFFFLKEVLKRFFQTVKLPLKQAEETNLVRGRSMWGLTVLPNMLSMLLYIADIHYVAWFLGQICRLDLNMGVISYFILSAMFNMLRQCWINTLYKYSRHETLLCFVFLTVILKDCYSTSS